MRVCWLDVATKTGWCIATCNTYQTGLFNAGKVGKRKPVNAAERNAHFRLGPDLETVYSGHKVRVSLTVKPTDGAGAQAFEFNYSAGKAGNSGWIRFDLKLDWDTYTAEIDVPRRLLENSISLDYLSVRPVVPEKTRGIELREIRFRRLGEW